MDIRKFRGTSMREVLNRIRKELGEDAVILHTRTYYQRDGWRFWRRRELVEITASADVRILDRSTVSRPAPRHVRVYSQNAGVEPYTANPTLQVPKHLEVIRRELEELRDMTSKLLQRSRSFGRFEGIHDRVYSFLLDQEVEPDLVEEIVSSLLEFKEEKEVVRGLAQVVERRLGQGAPINKANSGYKVVLVGPTGVGKTTTIAKLAARYALLRGKKVGLLTVDTFRIAAVDQLRTYAEIMRLPIEVVVSPQDVPGALKRLADRDIVFVDTAGRSQRNEMQMSELRAFLNALDADEVHLVLSATSSLRTLKEVVERFEEVKFDKIIFTKMDETLTPGIILNGPYWTGKPISYLTTGQSVPDDIEELNERVMAGRLEEALLEYVGSGTKIA